MPCICIWNNNYYYVFLWNSLYLYIFFPFEWACLDLAAYFLPWLHFFCSFNIINIILGSPFKLISVIYLSKNVRTCQIHKQGIWTKLYFHFCRLNLVSCNPSISKSHNISFTPVPIAFRPWPWLTTKGEWVRKREKCQNAVVQDTNPEKYISGLIFSDHACPNHMRSKRLFSVFI